MKVVLVSNVFPNAMEAERGIFTYQLAQSLSKQCRVEVAAPLPWIPTPLRKRNKGKYVHGTVPINEQIGGLAVHHPRFGAIPGPMSFMHPLFMFWPLLRLIKLLDRIEPVDLINAHWLFPDGVAAAWVGDTLKKKVVLTALGCDINHYPTLPFRRGLIQRACSTTHMLTVKGNSLRDKALELGVPKERIMVIPNGLDSDRFHVMERSEARRLLGIGGGGPFLLTVGSLDEVKGTRFLLQALKKTKENFEPAPHLLIVGDGHLKQTLKTQARDLGILRHVSFHGRRPHREIPLWMNAADLFCLPSIREGRPNALLEALACGTPVVASEVGSIPEIIHEGNGRMVSAEDAEGLCRGILLGLNQTWDREAIRQSVPGPTWDECATMYMKAFSQILQEKRRRTGVAQCAA